MLRTTLNDGLGVGWGEFIVVRHSLDLVLSYFSLPFIPPVCSTGIRLVLVPISLCSHLPCTASVYLVVYNCSVSVW